MLFDGSRNTKYIDSIFLDESRIASVSDPNEIANEFANHFMKNHGLTSNDSSTADVIVQQSVDALETINCGIAFNELIRADIVNEHQLNEINELLPESNRHILTSVDEVSEIINARPNKTSTGDDNMPITVLKKLSFENLLKITIIFNQLLAAGFFPSAWKHAIGCPIPKPGKDASCIVNWRPISLLNSISKIYEIILKR